MNGEKYYLYMYVYNNNYTGVVHIKSYITESYCTCKSLMTYYSKTYTTNRSIYVELGRATTIKECK